jgi:thiamine-monophosphate kinase
MGEFELLARIRERLPATSARTHLGSGDDAAITVPGGATATSVDALVDGVHFRRELASFGQIGHKALATALSDLAAMGAAPGEAYVTLGIPPDLDEDDCLELLEGMLPLVAVSGVDLAGGDLTRAAQLFLSITVVGHATDPRAFVGRGGAQPGDALVVTGELGAAAAGLVLLERPETEAPAVPAGLSIELQKRQLEPQPRLGAGQALARCGATAMIDLSDGLAGDALHLAERGEVALKIELDELPQASGATEVAMAAGLDPWRLLAAGGEDYELLASIPPERLDEAERGVREEESLPLTRVGEILPGAGVEIRLPDGRLLEPEGFDQLA